MPEALVIWAVHSEVFRSASMTPNTGIATQQHDHCPSWPGLLLNGNLRTLSACGCVEGRVTPGIASLNPGLVSSQPFRAAGLHAGGVKEISPR